MIEKVQIKTDNLIIPKFEPVLDNILDHKYSHYDFPGGRGSTKSSFVSIVGIMLLLDNPYMHGLVLRKVANTLRDSVYTQYQWAIYETGLDKYFTFKVSPLEIIFKLTGQKIMFRGADEPAKIKSIKVPFGYIGFTHFEEKDQFSGREEIRTILQSTMRGGDKFWNFESYNPPISNNNWANKDSLLKRKDRLCIRSTYLDVPAEWLGQQFLNEAEYLKEVNEKAYRHEYLGEPTGTGGAVFDNVTLRDITDEEIQTFDRIYEGVDWGWFPDPFRWGRMYYNHNQHKLYIFDELSCNKKSNKETADLLIDTKGCSYERIITADSAEPKSIQDYRTYGLNCRPAVKGPDSVAYGMKWLQSLTEIVIDPDRCPETAEEFVEYEYDRDRDGEIISGYPDCNNHSIDMVRYALERVWRKRGL